MDLSQLLKFIDEYILKYLLSQIAKLLPKNAMMRIPFVKGGGYYAIQKFYVKH